MSARDLTWTEFCSWLTIGATSSLTKRLFSEKACDDLWVGEYVLLLFEDGSCARLVSARTEPAPASSEHTPGSDGHLTLPKVTVFDSVSDMIEHDRLRRKGK